MRRCWRREKGQETQGPRAPRSRGPKDQDISNSHSNMSLTLKKVHLVLFYFTLYRYTYYLTLQGFCIIQKNNENKKNTQPVKNSKASIVINSWIKPIELMNLFILLSKFYHVANISAIKSFAYPNHVLNKVYIQCWNFHLMIFKQFIS